MSVLVAENEKQFAAVHEWSNARLGKLWDCEEWDAVQKTNTEADRARGRMTGSAIQWKFQARTCGDVCVGGTPHTCLLFCQDGQNKVLQIG